MKCWRVICSLLLKADFYVLTLIKCMRRLCGYDQPLWVSLHCVRTRLALCVCECECECCLSLVSRVDSDFAIVLLFILFDDDTNVLDCACKIPLRFSSFFSLTEYQNQHHNTDNESSRLACVFLNFLCISLSFRQKVCPQNALTRLHTANPTINSSCFSRI